ncbi:DinB family protein [Pontibacter liquoris]|uniref:DinB family protein n=1 Tax=Pontibacter liquoris TaxID=2905677 RepID=UPI001FA7CA71|nr:DinB family protein [Pontibacter liquoris]
MALKDALAAELKHEVVSIRKMLERLPAESFGWKPHPKSSTLGDLVTHIIGLLSWIPPVTTTSDDLDLADPRYRPTRQADLTPEDLGTLLEQHLQQSLEGLASTTDEHLGTMVKLRNGEHVITQMPRKALIRTIVLNHMIHHRGQLSVYLRLLDLPVPQMYGPTADEPFKM